MDESPIDPKLDNYASGFSRAYLRHLVVAKELLAALSNKPAQYRFSRESRRKNTPGNH